MKGIDLRYGAVMAKSDTVDLAFPSDRRSGIGRRQFTYDVYIPERRLGFERRRFNLLDRSIAVILPEQEFSEAAPEFSEEDGADCPKRCP
jgi:hypothetical protein